MNLGTIIFDNSTDYASVVVLLNTKLSELLANSSSCGCVETELTKAVNSAVSFLYVAQVDLTNNDLVRYQRGVEDAYNALIKLELR